MAYLETKQCFQDNVGRIHALTEPVLFNMNNGLYCLTRAIESDMAEIKNLLTQILQALEQSNRQADAK
jgi:hypothetical protein